MDVKLIRNFDGGIIFPINKEHMLQMLDSTVNYGGLNNKRYIIYNPENNEKFEVMPEHNKFKICKTYYSGFDRDFIIYTTIENFKSENDHVDIYFYKYRLSDNSTERFHTLSMPFMELNKTIILKCFVCTSRYCIIQVKNKNNISLLIKDMDNNKEMVVNNALLNDLGIEKLVHLSGNICGIKLSDQIIGTVNINRFISDLLLDLPEIKLNILDQGNDNISLPYMRLFNDSLLYAKHDQQNQSEDVIIYDYKTNVKKVRKNSGTLEGSDFKNVYTIMDVPYKFEENDKGTKMINLNTQKTEHKFDAAISIKYVFNDLLVLERTKRTGVLFSKKETFVEVYKIPEFNKKLYTIKGKYNGSQKYFDELLIFV